MTNTIAAQTPETWTHTTLNLAYLRAGQGPAVVLLHGWGAFKELWWSTLVALAPQYTAFAPDLPGHGGSPPRGRGQMADLAELIEQFCIDLMPQPVVLVGHSMGGNIAVTLTLRRPELVRKLVLVDAALDPAQLPPYTRSYLEARHGWAAYRISQLLERRLGWFGRDIPHQHGGGLLRPWLRRSHYLTRHDLLGMRSLLGGLFENPLADQLALLNLPTLVVTGELDAVVPAEQARRAVAAIPGARLAVIRGAMHNPMDERPREFERVLLEFLNEC